MKGLIIKDLYCLKKEMKLFLGVTIGSAIVSVLFLLSARYGNIANALADIQKTEMISGEELLRLTDMLALLVIYLPIALTGCVVECFKEDSKAGFGNIMFSMPVSYKKIVGSRYLTCLLFFGVCIMSSTFCSLLVTSVSDSLKFASVFKGTLCCCAVFMIYIGFVMVLLYLLGTKRADVIQSIPFLIAFFVGIIWFAMKIEDGADILKMISSGKYFFEKYGVVLFGVAVLFMIVSYIASVKILERRRDI